MNIEVALPEDLPEILDLQKKAFLPVARIMDNYNLPPLLQTLDEITQEYQSELILKYTHEGHIVGSVRGKMDEDKICYVGKLIVHPDCQNMGIGGSLMLAIEEKFKDCKKYTLFTGTETPNTFYLYQKLGYREITRDSNNGIEMIYMEKENIKG